jgi:CHAT domain-containing protein
MVFENFDLLISDPATARVISAPGDLKSDPVELAVDVDDLTARYDRLLLRPNLSEDDLKALGGELFQLLMPEDIRDLFSESVGAVRGRAGLRIRLQMESAALASLPWELLFKGGDFLATNPSFSLCRYLPLDNPRKALPIDGPLHILVLVSAPNDMPPLDYLAERQALGTALDTMVSTRGVELVYELDARRETLLTILQTQPVHVLHFIGHGGFQDEHGYVYLEAPDENADPVEAADISNILSASNSLRLVTLNACATAQESAQRAFSGVASQLVRQGIPAVVAMRNAIEDRVAISFAKHLYGNLASGEPIDVALTRARQQLRLERSASPTAFILPILHLNAPDGSIFEVVSARQKRLVQVAQQTVQLSETSEALGEWKELHEILHMLNQSLDLVSQFANNPQGIALVPTIWPQFRSTLDGLLIPFAAERMRFIGRRYQDKDDTRSGEEWVVSAVEYANAIDQAVASQSLPLLLDYAGKMKSLLYKYLPLCNRRMVELLGKVTAAYQETRSILENLHTDEAHGGIPGLNWPAIDEELTAMDNRSGRISEWVRLHDLFDRLHIQFAVIAADAAASGTLEAVAEQWRQLRNDLIEALLEQARKISYIGRAFAQADDGSLNGEPWAIEIKRMSDQLDAAIQSRNLESTRQTIIDLDRLIKKHYLQVNRSVKDDVNDFTRRSFALQARVTP